MAASVPKFRMDQQRVAALAALSEQTPLKSVRIEALALMKIIKHSTQQYPSTATGALVGMDVDGVLEITNCFQFLCIDSSADNANQQNNNNNSHTDAAASAPRAKINGPYQNEMIKSLRDVNVDANSVGWYIGTSMGNFINTNTIENQFHYQKEPNERTVTIVHDVSRSSFGTLSLRAFRLSNAFMAAYREGKFTVESLKKHNLKSSDIFVELPVEVHNSHLVTSLLHQLPMSSSTEAAAAAAAGDLPMPQSLASLEANLPKLPVVPNLTAFELTVDPILERNADLLLDAVETHQSEVNNHQYYHRSLAREQNKIMAWQTKRKAENASRVAAKQAPLPEDEWTRMFKLPAEPSQLELLLNARQVEQYARQLDGFSATITSKMFAVKDNLVPATDRD